MKQLTFVAKGRLEWREVPDPVLQSDGDALVRPFVAARCDGDSIFLFHDVSRALQLGACVHLIDAAVFALGRPPFAGPFPYGHEGIGEVVALGSGVKNLAIGQAVIIPWAVSCGTCATCKRGLTSNCETNQNPVSGYGFGPSTGGWGGLVSDLVRVPYAGHMLVPVPSGVDPKAIASASDNLPDAYRAVGPFLSQRPGSSVLVLGGDAKSIGLYAAGMAVALGAGRVDYLDKDRTRLDLAAKLGANPVFTTRKEPWFRKGGRVHEPGYDIAVDASGRRPGVAYAVGALAAGGVCTGVGFYLFRGTPLPVWRMYLQSTTFRTGLSHPSADIPKVLQLVAGGAFDPAKVTSRLADWDSAHEAFLERGTKVVVSRPRLHGPKV